MVLGKKSNAVDLTRYSTNLGSYVFDTLAPALVGRFPPAAAESLSGIITIDPTTPAAQCATSIAAAARPAVVVSESLGSILALASTLPVAFAIRGADAAPPIVPLAGSADQVVVSLTALLAPTSSVTPSPSPMSPYADAVFLVLSPTPLAEFCADLDAAANGHLHAARGAASLARSIIALTPLTLLPSTQSTRAKGMGGEDDEVDAPSPDDVLLRAVATASAIVDGAFVFNDEKCEPLSVVDAASTVHVARTNPRTPAHVMLCSRAAEVVVDEASAGAKVCNAGSLFTAVAAAGAAAIGAAVSGDAVPLPPPSICAAAAFAEEGRAAAAAAAGGMPSAVPPSKKKGDAGVGGGVLVMHGDGAGDAATAAAPKGKGKGKGAARAVATAGAALVHLPRSVDSLGAEAASNVRAEVWSLPVLLPAVGAATGADVQGAIMGGVAVRAAAAAGAAAAEAVTRPPSDKPLADEVAAAVGDAAGHAVLSCAVAIDQALLRVCIGCGGAGGGGVSLALERIDDWAGRVSSAADGSDSDDDGEKDPAAVAAKTKAAVTAQGGVAVSTAWRVRAPMATTVPITPSPQALLASLHGSLQHIGSGGGASPRGSGGTAALDSGSLGTQKRLIASVRRFVTAAAVAFGDFSIVLQPGKAVRGTLAKDGDGAALVPLEVVWSGARARALPHPDLLTLVTVGLLVASLPAPLADSYAASRGLVQRGWSDLFVPTPALTEDPACRGFASADRYVAAACTSPIGVARVSFAATAIGDDAATRAGGAVGEKVVLRAAVTACLGTPYKSAVDDAVDSLCVLVAAAIDGAARRELGAGPSTPAPPLTSIDCLHPLPGVLSAAPLSLSTRRALGADLALPTPPMPRAWQSSGRRPLSLRDICGLLAWGCTIGPVGRSVEAAPPAAAANVMAVAAGAAPVQKGVADFLRVLLKGRYSLSAPPVVGDGVGSAAAKVVDGKKKGKGGKAAAAGDVSEGAVTVSPDASKGALLEVLPTPKCASLDEASRLVSLPFCRPISEQVAAADQLALSLLLSVMPDGTRVASIADIGARLGGWSKLVNSLLPNGAEIGKVGGPSGFTAGMRLRRTLPDQLGAFVLLHPEAVTLESGGLSLRRVDPRGRRTAQMLHPERLAGLLPTLGDEAVDESDDEGAVARRGGRVNGQKLTGWGADMFDGLLGGPKKRNRADADEESSAGSDISAKRRRAETLRTMKDERNPKRKQVSSEAFLPVSRSAKDGMEVGGAGRLDRASGRKLRNLKWRAVNKQRTRSQKRVVQGFIERRGAALGNADR